MHFKKASEEKRILPIEEKNLNSNAKRSMKVIGPQRPAQFSLICAPMSHTTIDLVRWMCYP